MAIEGLARSPPRFQSTDPVPESLERVRALVDKIYLVDDADLRSAIDLIADSLGDLVGPAGLPRGVAALVRHRQQLEGNPHRAVLLTGAGTPG